MVYDRCPSAPRVLLSVPCCAMCFVLSKFGCMYSNEYHVSIPCARVRAQTTGWCIICTVRWRTCSARRHRRKRRPRQYGTPCLTRTVRLYIALTPCALGNVTAGKYGTNLAMALIVCVRCNGRKRAGAVEESLSQGQIFILLFPCGRRTKLRLSIAYCLGHLQQVAFAPVWAHGLSLTLKLRLVGVLAALSMYEWYDCTVCGRTNSPTDNADEMIQHKHACIHTYIPHAM